MKDLKEFDISFVGLKEGIHHFEYTIDRKFFDFFKYDDFHATNIKVDLTFVKKATLFELEFNFSGWVEVNCDLTNELFKQPISSVENLIVKFGEEFNAVDEELLIIPYAEFKLNVSQNIYEAIVLSVPIKLVHPGIADGTLKSEVLEKLKEFEIEEQEIHTIEDIDPRWNKLKEIKLDKNTSNGTS